MATNTTHLKLLKKNVATDGNETFNIETMLNQNWDKIDSFCGLTVYGNEIHGLRINAEKNIEYKNTETGEWVEVKPNSDIPIASTTKIGIVQLTNDLGDSETLAVTQKALNDIVTANNVHLTDEMPHQFTDGETAYKYGFSVVKGILTFNYEEVV